ncbi:MAG TPA: EscU/YscU/HrcU family type III secretion system export apparatus switch protein [Nocardioidaceae bacterium]|nr:EscU/YscU/HrcU family type III secretion system export apparatus switch protein [Nocardioidaceae bacterium]
MPNEEKTEKPTPKKLKESRKEGRVARTPELGAWGAMLALAVVLNWLAGKAIESVRELLTRTLGTIASPDRHDATRLLHDGGVLALLMMVALGACILLIGVAAALAQGGFFVATKALKPKWSRLNPIEGAKRLFGPHALWEGGKVLIKSALVTVFVWRAVDQLMPLLGGLMPIGVALELTAEATTGLIRDIAVAGLIAAAADYAMARRRTGKQVRMSKKEVRDEHKQSEGDPLVRSALRSRQLAASRNRMMADVPTADVVLVNPTHVAVALRYEPDKGSPRVVAKGAGVVAARIREVAESHRVALVEDVPLARALHAGCEVGQAIPPELYHAVAQVLAFVLSRRASGSAAGRHRSPRPSTPLPEVPRSRRRTPPRAAAGPSGPAGADSSGPPPTGR